MEKVVRIWKSIKENKTEFRKLEDDLEIVLDNRLTADKEIQKTNDIKEKKDPKYNPALLKQTEEVNTLLKKHKDMDE